MAKKFNYKKLVKEYLDWVERQTEGIPGFVPVEDIEKIEAILNESVSEINCRQLGMLLSYVGTWHYRNGVCLIAAGDVAGWRELHTAARYKYAEIRILCLVYDQSKNKFLAGYHVPSILFAGVRGLMCMAIGTWEEADWMARRLSQGRSDGSIVGWDYSLSVPYLIIALHRYLEGRTDVGDLELGVYKSVFEHWDDMEGLKKTLLDLADYHVDNIRGLTKTRVGEFSGPPVDIFPAEMVAIRRVRERLGLETPAIDHPLMQTPFADPPRDILSESDDLLDRALAKVRTIIPDL